MPNSVDAQAYVTQVLRPGEYMLGQPRQYMYATRASVGDTHRIPPEFTGSAAHFAGASPASAAGRDGRAVAHAGQAARRAWHV